MKYETRWNGKLNQKLKWKVKQGLKWDNIESKSRLGMKNCQYFKNGVRWKVNRVLKWKMGH